MPCSVLVAALHCIPETPLPTERWGTGVREEGLQTQLRWPGRQGCTGNSWGCQEALLVVAPLVLRELREEEPLAMQCVL